jgi:signal transduction histidine kinase
LGALLPVEPAKPPHPLEADVSLHEYQRIQDRLKSVADPVGFLVNLFAHAPVGFAVWTADGRALLTNNAFMELFGVEPPPEYNVLEDDLLAKSGMLDLFKQAFAGHTVRVPPFWYDPRELEVISVTKGRRVAISMVIFPLFKDNGEIDYVAATYKDETEIMLAHERREREQRRLLKLVQQMERDIEERSRLELDRARLEAQLRQSQKMEALGTLSGGIAHDFNNLLAIIMGNVALAREDLPAENDLQPLLDAVYRAGVRASALVQQILAFGRPQTPQRHALRIQPIVEEALALLRASIPAMVEIDQQVAADLPQIAADSTQIHQVLMNLGANAAHAMGARGGRLTVRAEAVTVSADQARTSSELREGPYVRISGASSSPSSPPNPWAKAPASACRWCTAS